MFPSDSRQRSTRQADELRWQSNPRPGHRERDTQVSEIGSNGKRDIFGYRSRHTARGKFVALVEQRDAQRT